MQYINISKVLMIDLAVLDCLYGWVKWSRNGSDRPVVIVFLYFSSFFLSQYSLVGV